MRDEVVYLRHIQDAILKINAYTEGGKKEFFSNPMIQDDVVRNLEIIREAAGNLSSSFRKSHSKVPWRQITAMRNVLAHEYFGVDLDIVWKVVSKRLPVLHRQVKLMIKQSGGRGRKRKP